jgi:hypothetical protein
MKSRMTGLQLVDAALQAISKRGTRLFREISSPLSALTDSRNLYERAHFTVDSLRLGRNNMNVFTLREPFCASHSHHEGSDAAEDPGGREKAV